MKDHRQQSAALGAAGFFNISCSPLPSYLRVRRVSPQLYICTVKLNCQARVRSLLFTSCSWSCYLAVWQTSRTSVFPEMSNSYSLYLIDQCDVAVPTFTDQHTALGAFLNAFSSLCVHIKDFQRKCWNAIEFPQRISPPSKHCECKAIKMFVQSGFNEKVFHTGQMI